MILKTVLWAHKSWTIFITGKWWRWRRGAGGRAGAVPIWRTKTAATMLWRRRIMNMAICSLRPNPIQTCMFSYSFHFLQYTTCAPDMSTLICWYCCCFAALQVPQMVILLWPASNLFAWLFPNYWSAHSGQSNPAHGAAAALRLLNAATRTFPGSWLRIGAANIFNRYCERRKSCKKTYCFVAWWYSIG